MEKPIFKTATKEELIEYIEYQDKILNGVSNLQMQLCLAADMVASDVAFILANKTAKLKILNQENTYIDHIKYLIKNKSDWMDLEPVNQKTADKPTEKIKEENKKAKTNIQDFVLKS